MRGGCLEEQPGAIFDTERGKKKGGGQREMGGK